jgi:hypothetical protein
MLKTATDSVDGWRISDGRTSEADSQRSEGVGWKLFQDGCGTRLKPTGKTASPQYRASSTAKGTLAFQRDTSKPVIVSGSGLTFNGDYWKRFTANESR